MTDNVVAFPTQPVPATLTRAEVEALTVDTDVSVELLVNTLKEMMQVAVLGYERLERFYVAQATMWLAAEQDPGDNSEIAAAANLMVDEADVTDELVNDQWAHDWRLFWQAHGEWTKGTFCCVCGLPAIYSAHEGHLAACSRRHELLVKGRLEPEDCRVCGEVKICGYEDGDAPVCAECWPGERVLAERRAAWAKRWEPLSVPDLAEQCRAWCPHPAQGHTDGRACGTETVGPDGAKSYAFCGHHMLQAIR